MFNRWHLLTEIYAVWFARLWQCRKTLTLYRCVIASKKSRDQLENMNMKRKIVTQSSIVLTMLTLSLLMCAWNFKTSSKHEMLSWACMRRIYFFSRFVTVSYVKCAQKSLSLSRVSWFMSQFSGFMGNEKYIKSAISFSITFFSLALRKFKILIPIITFVSKISSSSLTFKTRGFDIYKRQRKITHKEAFFCMVKKSFIISSDNSF